MVGLHLGNCLTQCFCRRTEFEVPQEKSKLMENRGVNSYPQLSLFTAEIPNGE